MSRLHHLLTCGLLAASVTGCQSARNTADYIVHWRPFGSSQQAESVAEAETAPSEEALVAELGAEQAPTAEALDTSLSVQAVSQEVVAVPAEIVTEEKQEQPAEATAETDNSFEAFIRQMEQQNQQPANATATEDGLPPAMPLVTEKSAPAAELKPSEEKTEDALSAQIEKLLAEYEPAQKTSAPNNEVQPAEQADEVVQTESADPAWANQASTAEKQNEPPADGAMIKQAKLSQKNDAGLVAYDLASFADVSIGSQKVADEASQKLATADDFAAWVDENSAQVDTTVEKTTEAVTEAAGEFDWAKLSGEIQQSVTEAAGSAENGQAELACVESHSMKSCDVAAAKIETTPASSEVLKILEQALGSEDWKKAELSVRADQQQLTAEQQKILEMLQHKNYQVRLRGVRLTYEKSLSSSPLAAEIVQLLDDENELVQAHAASTLYHWNLSKEDAIETLSEVVTSSEGNAAQLAAMFLGDMKKDREQVVPVLKTALLSTQGITSLHVAEALLKHEPANVDAVARLTELMRHQDVEVRWLTAHALGSVQGELQPFAVEALRTGLRDIDSQVRATSALSLGGLGKASEVAVAELTFISTHAEPKVRDAANIALECIIQ